MFDTIARITGSTPEIVEQELLDGLWALTFGVWIVALVWAAVGDQARG